ncbi:MAG: YARHG domain-containing protein [Treponema sp.]|jgi:hypothetical protein|nr:YARHG domain-containing protein [Treponema sp.]
MNRKKLLVVILFAGFSNLYAQDVKNIQLDFVSFGFNTCSINDKTGCYFYNERTIFPGGYEDSASLYVNGLGINTLSLHDLVFYSDYNDNLDKHSCLWNHPGMDSYKIGYEMENVRLVNWNYEYLNEYDGTIRLKIESKNITQDDQGIIIYGELFTEEYDSNTKHIIGWPDALRYFNKEELSIFRNYIFKRNGYCFKNNEWIDFFGKYNNYDITGNINTEQIAMDQMPENEKWLLEQIIKEEK